MTKLLITSILVFIVMSCIAPKNKSTEPDYVVFTFRKTECYGRCPAYFMEIYKSGKLTFEGKKNTDKIGKYTKQIATKEVESLIAEFEKAEFFKFENEYTARVTDLPSTYISFTNSTGTKNIHDYHGAPKELKTLETLLINIANSGNWVKIVQ